MKNFSLYTIIILFFISSSLELRDSHSIINQSKVRIVDIYAHKRAIISSSANFDLNNIDILCILCGKKRIIRRGIIAYREALYIHMRVVENSFEIFV